MKTHRTKRILDLIEDWSVFSSLALTYANFSLYSIVSRLMNRNKPVVANARNRFVELL